jgi:hypothetical protein
MATSSLPAAGQRPAATWSGTSLVLTSERGVEVRVDFEDWVGSSRLIADLAGALEKTAGPLGVWRSERTMISALPHLKALARWCSDYWARQGAQDIHVLGLAELTPALWNEFRLDAAASLAPVSAGWRTRIPRTLLLDQPALPEPLRRHLAVQRGTRNIGSRRVDAPVQESYTAEQMTQIEGRARGVVNAAYLRIKPNMQLLSGESAETGAGNEPSVSVTRVAALRALIEHGTPSSPAEYRALDAAVRYERSTSVSLSDPVARRALFLTHSEAVAAAVLLTCRRGYNITTLMRLGRPSSAAGAGSGREVFTANSDKPRRGAGRRYFQSVLADTGADSDGWWVSRLRLITEPARERLGVLGLPNDPWLIWAGRQGRTSRAQGFLTWGDRALAFRAGLLDDWWPAEAGSLTFQKLHRSYQTVSQKTPTHNTRSTHLRSYRYLDNATRSAARAAASAAMEEAVQHAHEHVRLQLLDDDDVTDPQNDTVLGSCRDFAHHPDTGGVCEADFFACLSCLNAVAAPRHHRRLVLAHDTLDVMRGSISAAEFERKFSLPWMRLVGLLAQFSGAELRAARSMITDLDREVFRALLNGRLQPSSPSS